MINSDCTLIISREIEKFKPPERQLAGGTWKTYLFAVQHHKPHMVIVKGEVANVHEWLAKVAAIVPSDFAARNEPRNRLPHYTAAG